MFSTAQRYSIGLGDPYAISRGVERLLHGLLVTSLVFCVLYYLCILCVVYYLCILYVVYYLGVLMQTVVYFSMHEQSCTEVVLMASNVCLWLGSQPLAILQSSIGVGQHRVCYSWCCCCCCCCCCRCCCCCCCCWLLLLYVLNFCPIIHMLVGQHYGQL